MLHIGSSELIHPITENLYPLPNLSLFPLPLAPGSHFSNSLCYEFDEFKIPHIRYNGPGSICLWLISGNQLY